MYYRSEPGNLGLAQLAAHIADEEAGGSRFTDAKVVLIKTGKTEQLRNLVSFVELPGRAPKEALLQPFDAAPPEGRGEVWSGVLLVSGRMTPVRMFR